MKAKKIEAFFQGFGSGQMIDVIKKVEIPD